MQAYAYLRVSGKGQVDGDGFERQERAIRQAAQAHGFEIVKVYRDEGVSGTIEDRPALARMMVDLEENGHGIKTVIVERLDRLARDLMVQEAIIRDFQASGFDLISATEGPDLLASDPTRTLIRQVFGAIAEYDKSMTVLKLRAARERKRAKAGKCEGRKSIKETAPEVLREIKRLRRKRRDSPRRTYGEIAEELNRQGYRTVSGKPWTAANVQKICHRF